MHRGYAGRGRGSSNCSELPSAASQKMDAGTANGNNFNDLMMNQREHTIRCMTMENSSTTAQMQQRQYLTQNQYPRSPNDISDAPMITPTVNSRMTLSKASLQKHFPLPPVYRESRPSESPQQSRNDSPGKSQGGQSGSTPQSQFSAPKNPLDLLCAVSTHIAEKEDSDKRTQRWQQERQQFSLPNQPSQDQFEFKSKITNNLTYRGARNPAGQRHGQGVMAYPNGCHYSGEFMNDKRQGFGECHYPNGCVYTGFWLDGMRHGLGKMVYADRAEVYEGEWARDRRHGRGMYFRSDGRVDVTMYDAHDAIGVGTQWSPTREFVVRLVGGTNQGPITVGQALQIDARIGMPGVPKQIFQKFQYDQYHSRRQENQRMAGV